MSATLSRVQQLQQVKEVLGQLLAEGGTEEQALAKNISHAAQLARDAGGCLLPRPRRGEHLSCQTFLLALAAWLFVCSWAMTLTFRGQPI
jgi:hypothetical protein